MSTATIISLADGKRTAEEIAALVGVTAKHIDKVAKRHGLSLAKPYGSRGRGNFSKLCVETFSRLAKAGKFYDEIAAEMGIAVDTARKMGRRTGIAVSRRPSGPPKGVKKAAPPRPPGPQSVEEWIARNGKPPKYEPGTLDQLLFDTFASVGKTLTYSAGKGTSWTPYKVGSKNMNLGQVIAAANKIREAQGKPLLSEPRRKAPSSAAWGKARAA